MRGMVVVIGRGHVHRASGSAVSEPRAPPPAIRHRLIIPLQTPHPLPLLATSYTVFPAPALELRYPSLKFFLP